MVYRKKVFFIFTVLFVLGSYLPVSAQELLTYSSTSLVYTYYLDSSGNQVLHGKRIQKDWTGLSILQETDYSHGQINGYDKAWWDTGARHYERQYVNDVLNGTVKEWSYEQILIRVAKYLNGKLHGAYATYHAVSGDQLIECSYFQGMLHGSYKEWVSVNYCPPNYWSWSYNQVPVSIGQYAYDKKYGTWTYYTRSSCSIDQITERNEGSAGSSPPGGDNPTPINPDPAKKEIRGRVLDEQTDAAVSGALIQSGTFQATSDANGFYSLKVDAGQDAYQLTCGKTGYYVYTADVNLYGVQSMMLNITLKQKTDSKPAVTNVLSQYGTVFLEGVSADNWYAVYVDWSGLEPGKIVFIANGVSSEETVSPYGTGTMHTFDMSQDFKAGLIEEQNTLTIVAFSGGEPSIKSEPYILHPIVIPLPEWSIGYNEKFSVKLDGKNLVYTLALSFPEKPMEVVISEKTLGILWDVWGLFPYIGGRVFGIEETQVFLDVEAKTDGTGSVAAGGKTGFEAAGGKIEGKLGGKGSLQYKPNEGLCWVGTSLIFGIEGKLEKEVGPVTIIPALESAVNWPVVGPLIDWFNEKGKVKGTIKVGTTFDLLLIDETGSIAFNKLDTELAGGLGLALSVELIEDMKAEMSGEGVNTLFWQVPAAPPEDPSYFKKTEAELSAKLGLTIWSWEFAENYTHTFTYPAEPGPSPPYKSLSDRVSLPGLRPVSKKFLTYGPYNRFAVQPAQAQTRSLAGAPAGVIENKLIDNVYPYSSPAFAASSGKFAIAYVYYDPEDDETDIYFTYSDGGAFAAPAPIQDDTKFDFAPAIAFDSSGKVVAVWQQVNDSDFDNESGIEAMAQKMEIVYAVYNPATSTWDAPVALTGNTYLDYGPDLKRGASGDPLLIWKSNEGNKLVGTSDNSTTIHYAKWNGSGFATPGTIAEQLSDSFKFSFAYSGSEAVLAYMKDMDGDLGTTEDEEIFYLVFNGTTWGAPVRLTNDASGDTNPQVVYSDGSPELVWLKGENLARLTDWFTKDSEIIREQSGSAAFTDFKLLCDPLNRLVVLWQDSDQQGADIFYSVYDSANDAWSSDLRLTDDPELEKDIRGAFAADATLHLVYNKKDLSSLQTDLYHLTYELGQDLAIASADLSIDPDNASAGGQATLSCTVHNTGDLALSSVQVAFYLGNPDNGTGTVINTATVSPAPLKAGWEGVATVSWTLPSSISTRKVYAKVDPSNAIAESNESNNSAGFNAIKLDVAATGCSFIKNANGTYDIIATIENTGAVPVSNVMVRFKADNATLPTGTITVAKIYEGKSVDVAKNVWPDPTFTSVSPEIEVVVDPLNGIAESSEENNNILKTLYLDLVSPKFYSFGGIHLDNTSLTKVFTITNPANASLVIGQLALAGEDQAAFSILNDLCSNKTLTPSSMCTMEIKFLPVSPYTKTASLPVPYNDAGYPLSIGLQGEGLKNCTVNEDCPDDNNTCNGPEICSGDKCAHGTPPVCNDNNPCTDDSCDPAEGCQHAAVPDSTSCSDALFCNGPETCNQGVCSPGATPCAAGYNCVESQDGCVLITTTTTAAASTTTTIEATTTTTIPSDTTTTTTPSGTTTTTTPASRPCPAKKALNTEKSGVLSMYYKLRDARLSKTEAGRNLTKLYYRHAAEISQILSARDGLRAEARRLLLGCAPYVFLGMFRNKELNISPANQERMVDFINELKEAGSPELQADLTGLLARLADGSLQQELGYRVR